VSRTYAVSDVTCAVGDICSRWCGVVWRVVGRHAQSQDSTLCRCHSTEDFNFGYCL
jgi:hypothetical protein